LQNAIKPLSKSYNYLGSWEIKTTSSANAKKNRESVASRYKCLCALVVWWVLKYSFKYGYTRSKNIAKSSGDA
jgi:hypothetical protein